METTIESRIKAAQAVLRQVKERMNQGAAFSCADLLQSVQNSSQDLKTIDWESAQARSPEVADWRGLCEAVSEALDRYDQAISWEHSSNTTAISHQCGDLQQTVQSSVRGITIGGSANSLRVQEGNYRYFTQKRSLEPIDLGAYQSSALVQQQRSQLCWYA